ncbi:uncharacterized protein LOC133806409 [Humulus lupulus]|uniref:uncharacterized protein LOC133806409 n=1 Tax=Humulus lupulus TaxID=3486 RepID=UPI002B4081C0|nr:uncharacterized protein LOC133806409 [Humulus lupulus]
MGRCLALAGDPYPETQSVANVLSGLDVDYLPIIVLVEARQSTSWQELQDILLSYDSKMKRLNSLSGTSKILNGLSSPTTNLANKGPSSGGNHNSGHHGARGGSPRNRGRTSGHGRGGRSSGGGPKLTCQVCRKYGHSTAYCYNRFDESYMGSVPGSAPFNPKKGQGAQSASAFIATPEMVETDAWCADSRASNHITAETSNMKQKVEYNGKEKLIVGDGNRLNIAHVGSSLLSTHDNSHLHKVTKKVVLHGKLKDGLYQFTSPKSKVLLSSSSASKSALFSGVSVASSSPVTLPVVESMTTIGFLNLHKSEQPVQVQIPSWSSFVPTPTPISATSPSQQPSQPLASFHASASHDLPPSLHCESQNSSQVEFNTHSFHDIEISNAPYIVADSPDHSSFELQPAATSSATDPLVPSPPMMTRSKVGIFKPKVYMGQSRWTQLTKEPSSIEEALAHDGWKGAMLEELKALDRNQTWTLVPQQQGMNIVGNKWVF